MQTPQKNSFATGTNAAFVEALYEDFKKDPASVEQSWRHFFEGYEFVINSGGHLGGDVGGQDSEEAKVEALINAYRRLGHLSAHLNPLASKPPVNEDIKPEYHGLKNVDPGRLFHPSNLGINKESATFVEILDFLVSTYCGTIGADYRESNQIDAILWLQKRMESCQNKPLLSKEMKLRILNLLTRTEGFERFLQDRYLGQKRFSIEGLDAMIVLLDVLADEACAGGAEEIDIGMAHRGRLNVLANFLGKPYEAIIKEFEGTEFNPDMIEGDVKYHKGFANEIDTFKGGKIRVYLSPNPSHLEAVNPVVEGFARARQRMLNDPERKKVLPVLIHGDAAFVGQGIVAETLNCAELSAYTTGGTIHIVANNQVGFTANPEETKSCDYSSDIAKLIRAPVLHVNADDPEAVVWTAILAVAYRQTFQKDFVIDLVGYRKHGHNETDEPGFTQPLMYKTIKDHPSVLNIYAQQLVQSGVVTNEYVQTIQKEFRTLLQDGMVKVREGKYQNEDKTPDALKGSVKFTHGTREDMLKIVNTSVSEATLQKIGESICNFAQGFTPHPKIVKLYESRREMLKGDGAIDWGMAELLAFGATALEGHHVRLSGQDCGRGTFSHRHAVLRDFETGARYEVLNHLGGGQARVDIINSPLSEAGCLGFEFGYSVADQNALVLWEAQFGDFVNGAQIILDQFVVASEAKWKQTSGLTLLLPHGYEGQGPEHSSARLERFLQSCGNANIQVANVTTPAQFFHLLRRQIVRSFRKPLVVMTPKSLLRHPKVISPLKDFTSGHFLEILDDQLVKDPQGVARVLVCTGKIYYDLMAAKEKGVGSDNVAIIRLEQLYPFALDKFADVMSHYPNAKEIVWTQEEPMNMGAWMTMRHRLEEYAQGKKIVRYVGRKGSGSTAEGSAKSHALEQQRIVEEALNLKWDQKAKVASGKS